MMNFYCPDFYNGSKFYLDMFDYQKKYPYLFREGVNIKKIFGSFPGMLWNGGCIAFGVQNIENVKRCLNFYRGINFPIIINCTNPSIEETDVYDRYCNEILKLAEDGKNEILVSSPILEKYIRENYPKFKINRSILATEFDTDVAEDLKKYDTIVLARRLTKNMDYLKKINTSLRNRIELLCNDPCPANCPYMYEHYKQYGEIALFRQPIEGSECRLTFRDLPFWARDKSDMLLPHELKTYEDLGFTEFKLAGRGDFSTIVFAVVEYIIKEEYQYDVLKEFLMSQF